MVDTLEDIQARQQKTWDKKSAFSKGISYLSRVNYAIANATDYALTGGDVLDGAIKGLKGEEETTFSDVLENQGILDGDDVMSKVGKFVVGTGLDIITDPTSYLGIGALSKGTNIVTKAASKGASVSSLAIKFAKEGIQPTLSKAGTNAFYKLQKKKAFELGSSKLGREITEVESMRFMDDAGRLAANDIGDKMLKDTAVRADLEFKKTLTFAGNEIPGISKGFRKTADFIGDSMAATRNSENAFMQSVVKTTDVLRKTADMMFGSGVGAVGNEAKVARLVRVRQQELANKALEQTGKYVKTIDKVFNGLTEDVSAQITKALDSGAIDTLPTSLSKVVNGKNTEIPVRKLAKHAQALYAHLRRREEKLGVATANMWDNYVNHLYGSDLNPMQREAARNLLKSQTTRGAAGLSNNLQRTYATLEQAVREAGLTPIMDISKLLKARAAASVAATSNKKMMQDLAESVGVKIDPAIIAQKVLQGAKASGANMAGRRASFATGEKDMFAAIQQAYGMTNEGLNNLITRSTDDILMELKAGADKAADKFAFSILPKMKYMYGKGDNVLDYQKIRAEGLVPFKTSFNTIVTDKSGKKVTKAVEEYHLVPEYIRKNFLEIRGNNYQNQASKDILRAFDQVQNFLKGNLTVMFPAFHGRNAVSNVVQNFQDIGLRAASPWQQTKAIRLAGGKDLLGNSWKEMAQDVAVITNKGRKYTYGEVHRLVKDYGVLQRMEQRLDMVALKDITDTVKPNKVMDTLGKPAKFARGVGQAIEDQARILNFTANLERFGDPALAAAHSKKFLFDYNDLTPFEKGVMRRLIPFYTWQRKNIGLHTELLTQQFGMYSQKLKTIHNAQGAFADYFNVNQDELEANLPDYMKNTVVFSLGRNEKGDPIIINQLGLPEEQYFEYMGDLFNADLSRWLQKTASSMTLPVKAPIELMTGTNLYTGEPIEKADKAFAVMNRLPDAVKQSIGFRHVVDNKGKERYIADPWALWTIQNLGMGRYMSTVGKMFDSDMDDRQMEKYINLTTGIKIAPVDIEKQKSWAEYNQKRLALEKYRKEQRYTDVTTPQ